MEAVADRPALRGGGRGCRPPGDACGRPRRRSPDPRHRSRPRRAWCGRAVPARRQVRVRHRQEHGQQGLVHGAEGGRAGGDLLPDDRRARRPDAAVRRRGRARPRGAGLGRGAGADHPHGSAQPELPADVHRAAGRLAAHRDVRERPRACHRPGRRHLQGPPWRAPQRLRRLRPVPLQHPGARLGSHDRPCARRDRHGIRERVRRLPGLHRDLQRVPRHQRRLDRSARRRPHGLAVHLRLRRERRPDRGDRTHRGARAPARDARTRLRRRRRERARRRPRVAAARVRSRGSRLRPRVARLPARC